MTSLRGKGALVSSVLIAMTAASSASAADLGPYKPYDPPPPQVSYVEPAIWQGAYIGINGGYGWTDSNPSDSDGFFGGVQAGYNWQRDSIVWGIEGDIQASDIDGRTDFGPFASARSDIDWFSTIRGRVGFANGPFLIYATGGVAFADIDDRIDFSGGGGPVVRNSDTRVGYAVGGGLEWAFARNWTAKAEYLYLGFGDNTLTDGLGNSATVNDDTQIMRVGLNYKF